MITGSPGKRLEMKIDNNKLKNQVRDYWGKEPCGTSTAKSEEYTREYYDEIEKHRYSVEPEIFSFAQFTRFSGCRMLEVGVGAGTDFIQWVRAGALAHGIDLTEESIGHVSKRLELYGLHEEDLRAADTENLPYPDNHFDLVYSWGVIHHTLDTIRALEEIIRVTRPGGRCKIMVYNRHSLSALYKYLRWGILRGRPFRSISWLLFHHQESIGTKAYTIGEVKDILSHYPVSAVKVQAPVTRYDLLYNQPFFFRIPACIIAYLLGFNNRIGWFMTIEFEKTDSAGEV